MRDRDVTWGVAVFNVLLLVGAFGLLTMKLGQGGRVETTAVVQAASPPVYDTLRTQHDGVTTIRLVHYRGTGTCGIVASGFYAGNGVSVAIAAHPVPCPWAVRAPAPVER